MTEQNIYILKDIFYRVKQFYFGTSDKTLSAASVSSGEATEYIAALRDAEQSLFGESEAGMPKDADAMLLRAVLLIKEAFLDKSFRLAGDLAEAAVHLCGVYTFPFLSRERFMDKHLIPLREKHEVCFFEEEEAAFLAERDLRVRLRPVFHRPKHDAYYYEEDSDGEMSAAHPVLYSAFAVLGILLFVGALVGYGLLTHALSLFGAWVILGYIGAAALGVSLFSLLMAWIRQYMGHALTLTLLTGGGLCILISLLLL